MRTDVLAVGEVRAKQRVLERLLAPFESGPMQQPVRVVSVVNALALAKLEP